MSWVYMRTTAGSEELIFDKEDTFWRCPRCRNLCIWELKAKITKEPDSVRVA